MYIHEYRYTIWYLIGDTDRVPVLIKPITFGSCTGTFGCTCLEDLTAQRQVCQLPSPSPAYARQLRF